MVSFRKLSSDTFKNKKFRNQSGLSYILFFYQRLLWKFLQEFSQTLLHDFFSKKKKKNLLLLFYRSLKKFLQNFLKKEMENHPGILQNKKCQGFFRKCSKDYFRNLSRNPIRKFLQGYPSKIFYEYLLRNMSILSQKSPQKSFGNFTNSSKISTTDS